MGYKRVMLKLSGQAMGAKDGGIFGPARIRHIVSEVLSLKENGIAVAAVVGGGNVFRGSAPAGCSIERAEADNVGMLATVMIGIMLRAALKGAAGHEVRLMSAVNVPSVAEPYIRLRAERHLQKGRIVLLTGGIGQPFVTTDYPSVQRAIELGCDALLAAKHGVNGVFTSDPRVDAGAARYLSISFDEALRRNLTFMDQAALILARDHDLPVHVFNFDAEGCMLRICQGAEVGTFLDARAATRLAR